MRCNCCAFVVFETQNQQENPRNRTNSHDFDRIICGCGLDVGWCRVKLWCSSRLRARVRILHRLCHGNGVHVHAGVLHARWRVHDWLRQSTSCWHHHLAWSLHDYDGTRLNDTLLDPVDFIQHLNGGATGHGVDGCEILTVIPNLKMITSTDGWETKATPRNDSHPNARPASDLAPEWNTTASIYEE